MCGVKTNVVTAVEIGDKDASDTKLFPALMDATAEQFTVREVSADKGYGSLDNYKAAQKHDAVPYIAFKSTHTGAGGGLWAKMYHFYQYQRDEFLSHYHKRSNVESTFSMMKAKFGDAVRSKTETAMVNETLCKPRSCPRSSTPLGNRNGNGQRDFVQTAVAKHMLLY